MAIRSVINKVRGFSLVEFMIAGLLGGFALTTIGGIVISTQKSASEKSKQILLLQNVSSAIQQLKEDMLRAGFEGDLPVSARFLGESNVTYLHSKPGALGYVYKVRSDGHPEYRHVLYWLYSQTSTLVLCEKTRPNFISVQVTANAYGNCYSVFDPKQISVSTFEVKRYEIGRSVRSSYIIVRLSAHLTQYPDIKENFEFKVTQRNWHEQV